MSDQMLEVVRCALVEIIKRPILPSIDEVKVYLWQSLENYTSNPATAALATAAIVGGIVAFIGFSVFNIPILASGGIAAIAGGLTGVGTYYTAPKINSYAVKFKNAAVFQLGFNRAKRRTYSELEAILRNAILLLDLDEVVSNVMQRLNDSGYDKLAGIISTILTPALIRTLNMEREDAETIIGSIIGRYLENIEVVDIKNSALRNTIMRHNNHPCKGQVIDDCLALIDYITNICIFLTGDGDENSSTNFQ